VLFRCDFFPFFFFFFVFVFFLYLSSPPLSGLSKLLHVLQTVFRNGSEPAQVESEFVAVVQNVAAEEWASFAHFNKTGYTRNLLAAEEKFSLILNCWEPGQGTPVHSHASLKDSSERLSWGFVIEGDLMVVHYGDPDASGQRLILDSKLYNKTSGCLSEIRNEFHSVENINKTRRAISLHLYSPAFIDCCWKNHDEVKSIPVSYTPIAKDSIVPTLRFMGLTESVFTSFDALAHVVTDELKRGKDLDRMTRIFESLRFNPKEFQRYAHWTAGKYTRNLVGYNASFTLLMLCWDRGQESPIHDHAGSHCFMKILEGELHEVRYEEKESGKLALKSITQMQEEEVAYIDDHQGVHKMVNPSLDRGAISLHIYIPPYKECSIFNLCEGTKRLVQMVDSNAYNDKPFTPLELARSDESTGPIVSVDALVDQLQKLFADQDLSEQARSEKVQATLNRVHFMVSEWQEHVHFSEHNYTRMLLTLKEKFSLMLICWNPGQASPVHSHDHAPENVTYIKSILGKVNVCQCTDACGEEILSETMLDAESNTIVKTNKELGFHTTVNPSQEKCALSLHLYSPPMLDCVHASGVAPVVYCEKSVSKNQQNATRCDMADVLKHAEGKMQQVPRALMSPQKSKMNTQMSACASIFSDFHSLMEMLWALFEKKPLTDPQLPQQLSEILNKFEFNPKEVECYKSMNGELYSRRRVALHPNFEVFIVSWHGGQESRVHDHGGSMAVMKVLEGEIVDEQFAAPGRGLPPYVVQSNVLKKNDVSLLSNSTIHKTTSSEMGCCTLSIYAPPYDSCTCYCPKTGDQTCVCVSSSDCGSTAN
jgi:cysteine dioxygenase